MNGVPDWVAGYIGIPFAEEGRTREGCDCWGLVRLVIGERTGRWLPSYAEGYITTEDRAGIAALVRDAVPDWRPVDPSDACVLDVLLFRVMGQPVHVGLWVAPGRMLHVQRGCNVALEPFDGLAWGRRLIGAFRSPIGMHPES